MSARYPRTFRVRQTFERPLVADVAATVRAELTRIGVAQRVQPGQTVAITAGSRGITNIAVILKATVDFFRAAGAQPFIVAAMGSHGGGTPEGQRAILKNYGITEEFCGCPVRTSMETVVLDRTAEGIPVHFGRDALAADHVVVVGRVKPHTELFGNHQSGLMKMLLIGLGKHEGAKIYHRAFVDFSFDQIVRSVGRRVIEQGRILAGLGIVENAYDETGLIRAVLPQDLEAQDKELLALAGKWLPRLPFDHADLLLVDEIGKEISGCGMDTNVIGRKRYEHWTEEHEFPKIKKIAIRSLTDQTHGNATGLGKSEYCLTRVVEAMDKRVTYINVATACYPQVAMIPPHYDTDRELLDVALATVGLVEPPQVKLLWIRNTLRVEEVECGEAFLPLVRGRSDLIILTAPRELEFDAQGMLPRTMAGK
ncbi:MAG: [Fe-S]-binding protein [Pedosphaera sp.]|nr:MAG: [Fe-S]-binding protein [Pedosphaera sp.]